MPKDKKKTETQKMVKKAAQTERINQEFRDLGVRAGKPSRGQGVRGAERAAAKTRDLVKNPFHGGFDRKKPKKKGGK